jgi:hypothetical protein
MIDNTEKRATKYVIQRASESHCEWWTGDGWSDEETDARQYAHEPHAGNETGDESATTQVLER